jgi:hypothetical protein
MHAAIHGQEFGRGGRKPRAPCVTTHHGTGRWLGCFGIGGDTPARFGMEIHNLILPEKTPKSFQYFCCNSIKCCNAIIVFFFCYDATLVQKFCCKVSGDFGVVSGEVRCSGEVFGVVSGEVRCSGSPAKSPASAACLTSFFFYFFCFNEAKANFFCCDEATSGF